MFNRGSLEVIKPKPAELDAPEAVLTAQHIAASMENVQSLFVKAGEAGVRHACILQARPPLAALRSARLPRVSLMATMQHLAPTLDLPDGLPTPGEVRKRERAGGDEDDQIGKLRAGESC